MELFAKTCELLTKESSLLKKIEIISQALKKINDKKELELFCLYLTGLIYPLSVQKNINVGKALIRDAACLIAGLSNEEWSKVYRKFGEIGKTIEYILENITKQKETQVAILFNSPEALQFEYKPQDNITLQDISLYIERLSNISGNIAKTNIIAELLSLLKPLHAKYVVKLLIGNLRIGVQESTVEAAIAKAFDINKNKVSELNFYVGNIGEVAIKCREKQFDNIKFSLFHPIKAMLASAEVDIEEIFQRMSEKPKNVDPRIVEKIPEELLEGVWVEYKYDGIRAHIHKQEDRVEIFTRDLKRVTDQFPEIVRFFREMKLESQNPETSFLLDGEIIPYKDNQIYPFAYIQRRLGRKENINDEVINNPTAFIAYDLLYLNGDTLFEIPLFGRRNLLENYFVNTGLLFSTRKIVKDKSEFIEFFRQSKREGREGVMVKHIFSQYEAGKRGLLWLKYKQTLEPLDVVILEAEYGEGKNAKYLSSFTFGVWDHNKTTFLPIGKVSSGASEDELEYFTKYLPEIAVEELPNGYKVQPEVILEVGFENIQISNRYTSGFAVRFPRILRIRTGDKPLEEINTIEDVKKIYEQIKGLTTK